MSLPENHLRQFFQYDPVPIRYRHIPPRRRRNLSDDNPLTRLKKTTKYRHTLNRTTMNRVLDTYLTRIRWKIANLSSRG